MKLYTVAPLLPLAVHLVNFVAVANDSSLRGSAHEKKTNSPIPRANASRSAETPATSMYECNGSYSVCKIGDPQQRCEYFSPFLTHQKDLLAGFTEQDTCCKSATTDMGKKACFEHDKSAEYFTEYTQTYCLNGGLHSGFVWNTPNTYAKQPTRASVAQYYGGYVGRNKKDFNLSLSFEGFDTDFVASHDACAAGTKWKYFLQGFASENVEYGIGFEVLAPTGCIVRQTATQAGPGPTQEHAAGFVPNPPNEVPDVGNPGITYNKYRGFFDAGCAECLAQLYATDAKTFMYSSRGDTDWNKYYPDFKVYTQPSIETYYRNLFAAFGPHYEVYPVVQDCDASNLTIEVPPFCFVAYEIRLSSGERLHYTTSIVFNEDGTIDGEGVVTDVKGLGQRITAAGSTSPFSGACLP